MLEDKKSPSRHRVVMEQRSNVSITGVVEVISFDEECVVVDTEQGVLVIKGVNLHVNNLSLESGALAVEGEIDSMVYEEGSGYGKNKQSFFGKLFK